MRFEVYLVIGIWRVGFAPSGVGAFEEPLVFGLVVGEAVEVLVFVVDVPFFAGPLSGGVPPVAGVAPGAAVVEDAPGGDGAGAGVRVGLRADAEDFEGVMGFGVGFDGDREGGAEASQGQRDVASRWRALVGARVRGVW